MHPSSRRLTFAVGSSLLTASLATAGCAKQHTVNVKPDEPPHVNTAAPDEPAPEQPAPDDATTDSPEEPEQPDGPNVNTVPSK